MKRLLGYAIGFVGVFLWFSAHAPQAGAAELTPPPPVVAPLATATAAPTGSAGCVVLKYSPYGFCVPPFKLPKLL